MAEPVAEAAPVDSTPTQAEQDEFEADARTLDSKALAAKYPKRWEALRPHIDREVTTARKNFEAKHNEEVQKRNLATQWTTWWDGLTDEQRQTQPAASLQNVAAAKQILEMANVSPERAQAAQEIAAELFKKAKETEPDADFTDATTPDELFDRVINARWAKKEREMNTMVQKAVDAKVKEALAAAHISSEQPERLPGVNGAGGHSLSSYLGMSSADREAFRRDHADDLDRMTREAMGAK